MNNTRCIYCNKKSPSYIMVKNFKKGVETEYPCCCLKCYKKANRFFKYNSFSKIAIVSTILLYLILSVLVIMQVIPKFYNSIVGIILGLCNIFFPYYSNIDEKRECIKTTKIFSSIVGGLLVFMGILGLF